jgi:alanine racemase
MIESALSHTHILVDGDALTHNLAQMRGMLSPGVRLIAVAKANVYGHGPAAALLLQAGGSDMLAVTHIGEALALRQAGVTADILLFCPLLPDQLPAAIDANLVLTAASRGDAVAAAAAAAVAGATIRIHLKVDTGMGRLGVLPGDSVDLARCTAGLSSIETTGIYTHFGTAISRNLSGARQQLRRFEQVLQDLSSAGIRPPLAHCANSAATLLMPEAHLDAVRVGTLLYGQYPSAFLSGRLDLRPTWKLVSRVVSLKDVPTGWTVGYGWEARVRRPARLAVVPVGYADGLAVDVRARSRLRPVERLRAVLEAAGIRRPVTAKIAGQPVPVCGRISMQRITLDVTGVDGVEIGSPVELPCRRVTSSPLVPRVITHAGSIPQES